MKCLFIGKISRSESWVYLQLRDDEVEDASSALVANEEGDDQMIIPFQNDNLAAYVKYVEKRDESRSTHTDSALPVCSPLWTTEAGLECGGSSAFGYVLNIAYKLLLSDSYVQIHYTNIKFIQNVKKAIQLHTLVPLAPFTRPIIADAVGIDKGTSDTDVKIRAVDIVVNGPEDGWPGGVQP
ncbi:hypothetical protein K435DRAFT_941944 [Dendrothele bispora CBS 962.96]|uniref:Uncharacterized protein n=1 Tax=Dendrothele bispora (strain CBS 962.96) TaxID=1314807 RepID=A0A4S8KVB5_DENBC|nr:hypothetical protein K435DRAFT_941944 [Dendrothele bispora CBS 962.96]